MVQGIHIDNYHRVLDVILHELKLIQREGGMDVEVCFTGDNKFVVRKFIFSVAFVMGDCKGNDHLAGKYGSHTKGVRRISRACNCRSQNADDIGFKCKWVTQEEVAAAVQINDAAKLKEMSQHNIVNAFHSVCFGGDIHGIHGCTPVDVVVHATQLGIYKYTMEVFFKLLMDKATASFDGLAKHFFSLPNQRAKEKLPRTDYGRGVSDLKGLTAAEYSGCIFIMALVLLTDAGRDLCDSVFGDDTDKDGYTQSANYLYLFEMMMCFEQWAKKDKYWEIDDEEGERLAHTAIRNFLKAVKHIADRTEGHSWKLPKFHELKHLVWYITRFGSPRNTDAGMGEKNHQILAKWPSNNAQRRYGTFEIHSLQRLFDILVLHRTLEEVLMQGDLIPEQILELLHPGGLEEASNEQQDDEASTSVLYDGETSGQSTTFEIRKHRGKWQLFWPKKNKYLPQVLPQVLSLIVDKYYTNKDGEYICKHRNFAIKAEFVNSAGITYRAHPQFRGRPWYDWVDMEWIQEDGSKLPPIPAKVLAFVEYEKRGDIRHEAIVWSAAGTKSPAKSSVLSSSFTMDNNSDDSPKLEVIKSAFLGNHCFCFPNIGGNDPMEHFRIRPKTEWADIFCSV